MVKTNAENKHGYVPVNGEKLGRSTRVEHRECFNILSFQDPFLTEELPDFFEVTEGFFQKCSILSLRILRSIAIALKIEDSDYFTKTHIPMDDIHNFTTLRLLNYPPIFDESDDLQNVVRCGEHSDYGTITLLFQDGTSGLEVKTRNGDYIPVTPIPGNVLVNVGNILDYMTEGKLIAAKHRVIVSDVTKHQQRRSAAFFVHPSHNVEIQRLTGPKNPKPFNAYDFVQKFFDETYVI